MVDVDTTPAPSVYLVVGIPGSGKSTVARELAGRFPRGAHIECDLVQGMIVAGARSPVPEGDAEADRQLLLRARNASVLARSFHAAGVVPVIDDVVVRAEHLDYYRRQLKGLPVRLVVLAPEPGVAARRIAERDKELADDWGFLDAIMREEIADHGRWIDSSTMTVEQTVLIALSDRSMRL
ncbi:AAA family ATPase [Actinokineospora pegani]|uniref:AAA family ATPase n=1 Tax=Actinokineospora pegani TaxID=2654637 RepID=UPI0012E9CE26|nr:AAA family ATPase [Actinokineospora pegani]